MPFVFYCCQCGSMLYEDSKPVLKEGTYKRETYLEGVITKIGGKCPRCGHRLHIPPLRVDILPSQRSLLDERKREVLAFA